MVRDLSDSHEFSHSWRATVEAALNKYPNNRQNNIRSLDVVERRINDRGDLESTRLLCSEFHINKVMQWVMKVLGMPNEPQRTLEFSQLDLSRKRYELQSANKTQLNFLNYYEELCYTANGQNKTLLEQATRVDMFAADYNVSLRWAVGQGENALINMCKNSIPNGRMAINDIVVKLQSEWAELESKADQVKEFAGKTCVRACEDVKHKTDEVIHEGIKVADEVINEGLKVAKDISHDIVESIDDTTNFIKKQADNLTTPKTTKS